MLNLSDYTYELPPERIAQHPASPADHCRLLVCSPTDSLHEEDKHEDKCVYTYEDKHFYDLPALLPQKCVLFFNTSKVLKARLILEEYYTIPAADTYTSSNYDRTNIKHNWEIFFLTQKDDYTFEALIRPGKHFQVGQTVQWNDVLFSVIEQTESWRILRSSIPIHKLLEQYGQMPLPPYIAYSDEKATAYQPLLADTPWSVAAPTASLHFTPELFKKLEDLHVIQEKITLHVGLGTFQTVQATDITQHDIHTEYIIIDVSIFERIASYKQQWYAITNIWTTVMRTLESLPFLWIVYHEQAIQSGLSTQTIQRRNTCTQDISMEQATSIIHDLTTQQNSLSFATKLFLYPWATTRLTDGLITNFHLPKSSLLMLVAAYMWYQPMMDAYTHALAGEYLFYSFGDAMYIKNT